MTLTLTGWLDLTIPKIILPVDYKWTSYVKAFESYRITHRHTDKHTAFETISTNATQSTLCYQHVLQSFSPKLYLWSQQKEAFRTSICGLVCQPRTVDTSQLAFQLSWSEPRWPPTVSYLVREKDWRLVISHAVNDHSDISILYEYSTCSSMNLN